MGSNVEEAETMSVPVVSGVAVGVTPRRSSAGPVPTPRAGREDELRQALRVVRAEEDPDSRSEHGVGAVRISAVMTRQVICVREDAPAEDVRALLAAYAIGGAPVVNEDDELVGIVTSTDLLMTPDATASRPGARVTVSDLMSSFAFTLPESATVAQAAALMAFEGLHRIVVVDALGAISGLLSAIDVMRWIAVDAGYAVPRYTQTQFRRGRLMDD